MVVVGRSGKRADGRIGARHWPYIYMCDRIKPAQREMTQNHTMQKAGLFIDRRRTLPDYRALTRQPLRWMLPWLIVWVLCGVALASWSVLLDRVALIGRMLAPVAQARMEIALERAFSGRGPDEVRLAVLRKARTGNQHGPPLLPEETAMRIDGTSLHLNMQALGANVASSSDLTGIVSWRHAQPDGGATQLWVCGHAQPPAGAILADPQNLTHVAPELLPSNCRASR